MNHSVVVIVLHRRGRILLHFRDQNTTIYPNHLAFISGSAEVGESHIKAAKRELKEETGLRCYLRYETKVTLTSTAKTIFIFTARLKSRNFKIFEGKGAGWYSPSLVQKFHRLPWTAGQTAVAVARPTKVFMHIMAVVKSRVSNERLKIHRASKLPYPCSVLSSRYLSRLRTVRRYK